MNKKTGKLNIAELKETIVNNLKVLNPLKIILFGSYAYGNPNEDSDLDICIVEKSYKSKTKEKSKIRKLLKEIKIGKDILLVNENYFLSYSDDNWINTALYDIRKKGVVLYEKK